MLTGKYRHALDTKARIILPAKIREQLGSPITVLRGSDRCLTLYSAEEWEIYAQKISALPRTQVRELTRYLYSNSMEVKPDAQGRVLLPSELLKFAGIEKNMVTVGCGRYAEIWAEEIWNEQHLDEAPPDYAKLLAELGL